MPGRRRRRLMTASEEGPHRRLKSQDFPAASLYVLHGKVSEEKGKRSVGYNKFKKAGPGSVLITTTVAARGVDVDGVTLVITGVPYGVTLKDKRNGVLHCTGRTGRASAKGTALVVAPEAGLWAKGDPASSLLQWLEPNCTHVWTYSQDGELRRTRQLADVAPVKVTKQKRQASTKSPSARPPTVTVDAAGTFMTQVVRADSQHATQVVRVDSQGVTIASAHPPDTQ